MHQKWRWPGRTLQKASTYRSYCLNRASKRLKSSTHSLARCAYNIVRAYLPMRSLAIDTVQHHCQYPDASHAQPKGMELGRQDRILPGQGLRSPLYVVVLPPS
jgi:hypothetical protein